MDGEYMYSIKRKKTHFVPERVEVSLWPEKVGYLRSRRRRLLVAIVARLLVVHHVYDGGMIRGGVGMHGFIIWEHPHLELEILRRLGGESNRVHVLPNQLDGVSVPSRLVFFAYSVLLRLVCLARQAIWPHDSDQVDDQQYERNDSKSSQYALEPSNFIVTYNRSLLRDTGEDYLQGVMSCDRLTLLDERMKLIVCNR